LPLWTGSTGPTQAFSALKRSPLPQRKGAAVRLVVDTIIVISALLWHDAPRPLLHCAYSDLVQLYPSLPLLIELDELLRRDRLRERLQRAATLPFQFYLPMS